MWEWSELGEGGFVYSLLWLRLACGLNRCGVINYLYVLQA